MESDERLEGEAAELRERIEGLDRAPTEPYPEQVRREVAAWIGRARSGADRWTWKRLTEEIGINDTTLTKWYDTYEKASETSEAEAASMVPVELAGGGDASARNGLSVEDGEARVCGLSFEEAVEAARRLG